MEQAAIDRACRYYRRLARLRTWVESHYSEPITLARAAAVAGMEKNYFSSFFREKTGVKFTHWLTALRVEKAMELMESSNAPISEVGSAVGYPERRTFERAFKKCTNLTPAAYKRRARPEAPRA